MELMINENTHVEKILKDLKAIIEREDKRHQMDEHLTHSMRSLLEDEIIPQLENELEMDYDPSPYYLWDNSGGEPPVTLDEMHTAAYNRKYNR
tara:strand:+ start:539 stop:817 length:279 start_codon:yes stop_codon:yes gene_type:complete